jgi:hypothetical protein
MPEAFEFEISACDFSEAASWGRRVGRNLPVSQLYRLPPSLLPFCGLYEQLALGMTEDEPSLHLQFVQHLRQSLIKAWYSSAFQISENASWGV